jgi:CheY-like chemotaxis protein
MAKILVVDDDEMVRIGVSNLLQAIGYTTIEAADGLEAMHVYQSKHEDISLVLMDIVMPNLDGVGASKQIKELDPAAKVILMSAYSDRAIDAAHADAFLSKPFTSKKLFQTVHSVLVGEGPEFRRAVGH